MKVGISKESAENVLNLTLNLVRGMAVNSLWQSNPKLYKQQLSAWADVARGLLSVRAAAQPRTA